MGKTVEQLHQEKQQKAKIQDGAPADKGYEGEQRWCKIKGLLYLFVYLPGIGWMSQQFTKGGTPLALQTTATKTAETVTATIITTPSSSTSGEYGVFENLKVTNNFLDQYDNIVDAAKVINHPNDNTQAHTDYLKNKQIDIFEGQLDITGHYQGNQHSYVLDVGGNIGATSMLRVSNAEGSGSGRGVSIGGAGIEGTFTVHGTHYTPSLLISNTGEKVYITPDVDGGLNLRGDGVLNISGYDKAFNVYANVPDEAGVHRHLSIGVSNTSSVIQTDAGNIVLDINKNQAEGVALLPSKHAHVDLGAYNLKYRTLYVSELYAETLVAQDVMATIGGRILVAPTSYLQSDLSSTILYDWEVYPPDNDYAVVYIAYTGQFTYLNKNQLTISTQIIPDSSKKIRITEVPSGSSDEFNDLDWVVYSVLATEPDAHNDAAGNFVRGAQKQVADITYDGQTGSEFNPEPATKIKVYPKFSDDAWGNISGMSDGIVKTITIFGFSENHDMPMLIGTDSADAIEWEATYKVVSSGGNGNEYWEIDWFGQNGAGVDFWEGAEEFTYHDSTKVYIGGVHQLVLDIPASSNSGINDADDLTDWDSSLGLGKITPLGLTSEHNNFKDGEYAIMSAAPGGIQQTEVVKFTSDGQWQVHEVELFEAVPAARKQLFPDKNLNTRVTVLPTHWNPSLGHLIKNKSWVKLKNTHGITKYRWCRWKITEGHVAETKVATKELWLGDSAGGRWGETLFDWSSATDGIGDGVFNGGGAVIGTNNGLMPYWSDVYPGFKVWQTDSNASFYRAWYMLDKYSSLDWITDGLPQDTPLGYSAVTMDFGAGNDRALDEYRIQNDGGRCPKTWTIEGSHNGVDWDILDTQTDVAVWADNTWQTWTIDGDIVVGDGYDGSHSVHFTNAYIDPLTGEEAEDTTNPLSTLQFEIPTEFIGDLAQDDPQSLCYFTPFQYSLERDKDGTGINNWYAGDAIVSLGKDSGDGYIDLASTETTLGEIGPVISINKRTSSANWNDMSPTIALGNLRNFLDYGDSTMGLAIGNDLTPGTMYDKSFITADVAQGVRLQNVPLNMFAADQHQTVQWLATGELHIGKDITNTPLPAFSFFTGDTTYNQEAFQSGDLMIGSNADFDIDSNYATTGNLKWKNADEQLQIRSGQQVVHQFDSDGSGFLGLERGSGNTKGLQWDYNAVTEKYDFTVTGNLFVTDGTQIVGPGMDWKGVWQFGGGLTYYRYDAVHYNGSSYIVNTSAPSIGFTPTNDGTNTGHPDTSAYWDELAVSGTGINPVAMDITSTEQIFFYNQNNVLITPSAEYITVKAHCQNGDNSNVSISPSNLLRATTSTGSSLLSSVAINTDCYMHKADFEGVMSNNAATLTMIYDGVTDYKTFYKIQDAQDGSAGDGYTIIMSQSNYTFPCDEFGVLDGGFSYSEANPIITVFKNGVKIDCDNDTDNDVHFNVGASATNIDASLSETGTPPNDCLLTLSNLGAGTQVFASVDLTISIYDNTGLQTTITKRWTGTKSNTGAHGKNVQIHPDRVIIKYDTNGDLDPSGSAQDIVISGASSGVTGTWSWSVSGGGVGIASGADDYIYTIDVSQTTDPGGGGSWFVPGMTIIGERGGIEDSVTIITNTDGGEGRVGSTIVTYDHQSSPASPGNPGEYLWLTGGGGVLTIDGPWSEVGTFNMNAIDTYGNNHEDWFQTLVDAGTREIKFRYDDDNWAVLKCTSPLIITAGTIKLQYAVEVLASEGTHTSSLSDGVNVTFDVNFAGLPATSFVVNLSNPAANVPVTNAAGSYAIDNAVLISQTGGVISSYFNGSIVTAVYSFSAQDNCTTAGTGGIYRMTTILDTSDFFAKFLLTIQHTDPLTNITHVRYQHVSCTLVPAGADGQAGSHAIQYYLVTVGGGAVIHNGGGQINLRIAKAEGGVGEEIVDSGNYKLWDPLENTGSGGVLTTGTGVTDGGDGVVYDAVFDEDGINESREIQLHSGSEVIDSIKLIDLVDGVESTVGSLTFSAPLVWIQGPAPTYDWDPSASTNTVTCHFYNGSTSIADCTQVITRQLDGDLYLGTKVAGAGIINVTSTLTYEKELTVTFEDDNSKAVVSETFYALSGQATTSQLAQSNQEHTFNVGTDGVPGPYTDGLHGVNNQILFYSGNSRDDTAVFTVEDVFGNGVITFDVAKWNDPGGTVYVTGVSDWTNNGDVPQGIYLKNIQIASTMPGGSMESLRITGGGGMNNLPYIEQVMTIKATTEPAHVAITGENAFSFDSEAATVPEGNGWLVLNWSQGDCLTNIVIGDFSAKDADGTTCDASTISTLVTDGGGSTGNNTGTIRINHVDASSTNEYPLTITMTKDAVTDTMNILRFNSVEGPEGISHGLMLQASHYFWTKAQNDTYGPANIVMTAVRNGLTTATVWDLGGAIEILDVTFSDIVADDNAVLTIPLAAYSNASYPNSVEITATAEDGGGAEFTDTITLVKVLDGVNGVDALTYHLSNENVTLAGEPTLFENINYATTATDIQVYEGGTALIFVASGPGNGQYTVGHTHNNIDHGAESGYGTNTASYGESINLSADDASTVFEMNGYTAEGESFTGHKTQTVSLARTATGLPGDTWKEFSIYKTSADESSTSLGNAGSVDSVGEMTPPSGWSTAPTGALYGQPVWVTTAWWADYGTNTSWVQAENWSLPTILAAEGADNQNFDYLFDAEPGRVGVNATGGELGIAVDNGEGGYRWATYFDSQGDMFLKGAADSQYSGGLTWDHATNTLDVYGRVNISSSDATLSSIHGLAIEAGSLNVRALTTFGNDANLISCLPSKHPGTVGNNTIRFGLRDAYDGAAGWYDNTSGSGTSQFPVGYDYYEQQDYSFYLNKRFPERYGQAAQAYSAADGMGFSGPAPSYMFMGFEAGVRTFYYPPVHPRDKAYFLSTEEALNWSESGMTGNAPPTSRTVLDTVGGDYNNSYYSLYTGQHYSSGVEAYIETPWMVIDPTQTYDLRFCNAGTGSQYNWGWARAIGWGVDVRTTENALADDDKMWHGADDDFEGSSWMCNYADGENASYQYNLLRFYSQNSAPSNTQNGDGGGGHRTRWRTLIRETRYSYYDTFDYGKWNQFGATMYGCNTTAEERTFPTGGYPSYYRASDQHESTVGHSANSNNGGYWTADWMPKQYVHQNGVFGTNDKKVKFRFYICRGEVSGSNNQWEIIDNAAELGLGISAFCGNVEATFPATMNWANFFFGAHGSAPGQLGNLSPTTIIDGGKITTGKVQSQDGYTYFDLDNSKIQCKHAGSELDITTMDATDGFKRRGYDYPIYIGSVPEVAGWATSSIGTDAADYFGQKANRIFGNPRFPVSYESVIPEGRALMLQVTPIGASWNSATDPTTIWSGRKMAGQGQHDHQDYIGGSGGTGSAEAHSSGQYLFFYCFSDMMQSLASGLSTINLLFNTNTDGSTGPWTTYIPGGTDVSDLRICSIQVHIGDHGFDFTPIIYWNVNFEGVTIWEVEDQETFANGNSLFMSDFIEPFIAFGELSLGGGNPF